MKPLSKKYSQNRRCPSCSTRITNANSINSCKPCWIRQRNADPEFRKRVADTQRRILREDFSAYTRKCNTLAENRAKAFARPEVIEKLRANATRLAKYRTPETEAKRIAALIEANKRRRHDWLPDQYRDEYFRMLRNGEGIRAKEAKRIILDQVAADRKRKQAEHANLSPFERQERALQNGAQIVANDLRPSLGNPGLYSMDMRKAG